MFKKYFLKIFKCKYVLLKVIVKKKQIIQIKKLIYHLTIVTKVIKNSAHKKVRGVFKKYKFILLQISNLVLILSITLKNIYLTLQDLKIFNIFFERTLIKIKFEKIIL